MSIENISNTHKGFEFACDFNKFPVTFVNSLRRILLGEIATVCIRDVQIHENSSQMPHEMLRKRVELLPINVRPDDATTIRDGKIELRIQAEKDMEITTADFVQTGKGLIMKDRDFDTPLLFLRLRAGEKVHLTGRLTLDTEGVSQVCTATTSWNTDPEIVKNERKKWIDDKKDVREFDNFYYQKCFQRDKNGRPTSIRLSIESIGVIKSSELLQIAVKIIRRMLTEYIHYALEHIQRDADEGTYLIHSEIGGDTLGFLLQEIIYADQNVNVVTYDPSHPLKSLKVLKFNTKKGPESILRTAKETIEEYCSIVEKAL